MARQAIVWSRSELAQLRDNIESKGGKVTRVERLSDFPPRWRIIFVEERKDGKSPRR